VQPYFEAMGKNIVLVGDNGAGQVAKAGNQLSCRHHSGVPSHDLRAQTGVDAARCAMP